jgi:hypothetical protein
MALTKRDVAFFLERLCEQIPSFLKCQYKKRFGLFRDFKIKEGHKKLTSYILQSIRSSAGVSYSVCVYNLIGQSLCNYHKSSFPFLSLIYNVNSLNVFSSNQYGIIYQDLIYNVNKLNVQSNFSSERLLCLVEYTITKQ